MHRPSERVLRAGFLGLAITHLGLAAWMFFAPHSFFTTLGAFGQYNPHFERDTSTYVLAFAFGAGVAVRRAGWRVPVLAMFTLQYSVHALNHLLDVGRANNSWAGPVDLISLALAAVQFGGLLWLLMRGRPGVQPA